MLAAPLLKMIRKHKIYVSVLIAMTFILLLLHFNSKSRSELNPLRPSVFTKSPYYSPWGESRYYTWKTPSFFPPLRKKPGKNASDYCKGFPTSLLDNIQVVVKTGVAESEKNQAHLQTVTSCISNVLVFSDLEETVGNHRFIDALADLPPSYAEHPDMAVYTSQKETYAKEGRVTYSKQGWQLDRFKFLPMAEKAYAMRPTAKWYVFIETDVYYFWDTLFRLLDQLDPYHMHYLGSPVAGAHGNFFGYGGAGFVLSRGLLKRFAGTDPRPSVRYENMVKNECCGDAALGYAILNDTGVRLDALYPIFAGDELQGLRVNKEWWCVPLLALHRVSPKMMKEIWEWERTRPYNEKPFVLSSILAYTQSDRRKGPTRESWDNNSDDEQPEGSKAHSSVDECGTACAMSQTCLQYSYSGGKCKFGEYIQMGKPVTDKEIISGWDMKKMASLGFKLDTDYSDSCKDAMWLKPEVQ